jgi:hypothetical protein
MSTTVFAVRELCRSGQLKFVPVGQKWRISPGAIQDFTRAKEHGLVAHRRKVIECSGCLAAVFGLLQFKLAA